MIHAVCVISRGGGVSRFKRISSASPHSWATAKSSNSLWHTLRPRVFILRVYSSTNKSVHQKKTLSACITQASLKVSHKYSLLTQTQMNTSQLLYLKSLLFKGFEKSLKCIEKLIFDSVWNCILALLGSWRFRQTWQSKCIKKKKSNKCNVVLEYWTQTEGKHFLCRLLLSKDTSFSSVASKSCWEQSNPVSCMSFNAIMKESSEKTMKALEPSVHIQ